MVSWLFIVAPVALAFDIATKIPPIFRNPVGNYRLIPTLNIRLLKKALQVIQILLLVDPWQIVR